MIKNCTVSKSQNIGFTMVEGGPVIMVAVAAVPGARVTVDLSKITVIGTPFTRTGKDGIVRTYQEGEAAAGAIAYRKLAAVTGIPPAVLASSSDDEV